MRTRWTHLDDLVGHVQVPVRLAGAVSHKAPLSREISREAKVFTKKPSDWLYHTRDGTHMHDKSSGSSGLT
jgi:hypothetical protein